MAFSPCIINQKQHPGTRRHKMVGQDICTRHPFPRKSKRLLIYFQTTDDRHELVTKLVLYFFTAKKVESA